jgi:hypothetical protein
MLKEFQIMADLNEVNDDWLDPWDLDVDGDVSHDELIGNR